MPDVSFCPAQEDVELNWSPIGGGQVGRQLNKQSGHTGQTRLIAPIGDRQYDALQARLDRRFSNGFQLGVSYTLSKSTGIAGNPNRDGALRINIPEYYDLNKSLSDFASWSFPSVPGAAG